MVKAKTEISNSSVSEEELLRLLARTIRTPENEGAAKEDRNCEISEIYGGGEKDEGCGRKVGTKELK